MIYLVGGKVVCSMWIYSELLRRENTVGIFHYLEVPKCVQKVLLVMFEKKPKSKIKNLSSISRNLIIHDVTIKKKKKRERKKTAQGIKS